EQRLDVKTRHQHAEQPPGPAQLVEVADQRAARSRILDLHRDPAAIVPDGLVHLADGRRRRGRVVEPGEAVPPVLPELPGQHLVHGAGGQRRRGLLQPGQGGPVRPRDLGRQRRLEDRQRLAQLHRAALELTQDAENLLGGALLYLLRDDLGRTAADPLSDPDGGAARQPDRQPGHFGRPGHRVPGHVVHTEIVAYGARPAVTVTVTDSRKEGGYGGPGGRRRDRHRVRRHGGRAAGRAAARLPRL